MATYNTIINTNCFKNNETIISVDCNNVPWVNNNASLAFTGCSNLQSVSNLSNSISEAKGMFNGCTNLVKAPTIPSSVVNTTFIVNTGFYYAYDIEPSYDLYGDSINTLFFEEEYPAYGEYQWCYYEDPWTGTFEQFPEWVMFRENDDDQDPDYPIIAVDGQFDHNGMRNSSADMEAELPDYEWEYQGMFANCTNLVNTPNIENGITNMDYMFFGCSKLNNTTTIPNSVTSIVYTFYNCNFTTSPILPDSVVNMTNTFRWCHNLTSVSSFPTNVTNMHYTFGNCSNLITVPQLPNSVTDGAGTFSDCINLDFPNTFTLENTNISTAVCMFLNCTNMKNTPVALPNTIEYMGSMFRYCTNITSSPNIPSQVGNVYGTFAYCTNLTGNIYIHSEHIWNARTCFDGTTLTKNVYIPFQNNGVNTATYNAFINAGYTTTGTKNGVYLKDINTL